MYHPLMDDDAGHDGGRNQVVEFVCEDGTFNIRNLENVTLDALRKEIKGRPGILRATDTANGWTLLHHAVHLGLLDEISWCLLEARPELIRQRARNNGPLPIHLVNRRTPESVALLLAQKWPEALHLSYEPYEEGGAPFHCAIKNRATFDVVLLLFLLRYEPTLAASAAWRAKIYWMAVVLGGQYEALRLHETSAQDGVLALHLALQANVDCRVVRLVLSAWPASIRARDGNGRTSLHLAVANGLPHHMVVYLANVWEQAARERDNQGCLPIHYVRSFTPLWPDSARALVMLYPESLQQTNHAGEIPLHGAAQSKSLPLVRFLVGAYPAGLRHKSNDGLLPLHKAVQAAQPVGEQIVPYLIQQRPESVWDRTQNGRTVLHFAVVGRGGSALINLLLFHFPGLFHVRADGGVLALHDAATSFQDLGAVRTLIEWYPEAARSTTSQGLTPLHLVAEHRNEALAVALARILINLAPDLVSYQTREGWLPIHCAADVGPLKLVEFLVGECPASIDRADNVAGLTPLHCSSFSQPPKVVHHLAERCPQALATESRNGWLPLHYAAKYQTSLPTVQALVELLPDSLEVATTDGLGFLPLQLAVTREIPLLEIVQYLAERSQGSLRVRDASEALPMELAAWRNAPLDVVFGRLRKWPVCLLLRRRSVAIQVTGSPRPQQRRRRLNRLRRNVQALIDKVIHR